MTTHSHEEMKRMAAMARKVNDERSAIHSKNVLKKHIQTKFKTTMIGSLDQFEQNFGHLWGHGLDDVELTDEQFDMRELWQLTRTEILNNGNNQLRAALAEVDNNTIHYIKNQYEFLVEKQD